MRHAHRPNVGVAPRDLSDEDLERELAHVHEMRHDIFLSGTADELINLSIRSRGLECEYLHRFADRVVEAAAKFEDC